MSDEPSKLAENAVAADGPNQDPRGDSGGDTPSAESSTDEPDRVAGSKATSESANEITEQAATADGATADGATADGATADGATADGATADGATGEVAEEAEGGGEEPPRLDWYILKVQSNREKSIADALRRRVAVEGLDDYFGQVIVPTEKVTEFKGGKRRIVQRKLYPGYILVQMLINDDTWFLVRETPGIGDFTGSGGKPTPMQPHEVHRIVSTQEEKTDETPKLKISFREGDRVKINEGTFENFEGEVSSLDQASGRVVVMINIFGRSTPVELEYWQVEVM